MPLLAAWANVQRPALLKYVAKGKIRFRPLAGTFPPRWQEGDTVATRMRLWGVIPFGGVHYLYLERIDPATTTIATREWDRAAKVWNHCIRLTALDEHTTRYEDEIIIYAGRWTGLITGFAKRFYRHRQKRWQQVARKGLRFYEPRQQSSPARPGDE